MADFDVNFKQYGTTISISNVLSAKTTTSAFKNGGTDIKGDTYNSSYSYMRRAFDSAKYKENGNAINIAKAGSVVGKSIKVSYVWSNGCVAVKVTPTEANGVSLGSNRTVCYLMVCAGGGSGGVGGRTGAGGGGGSGSYFLGYLTGEVYVYGGSGCSGASGRGSNGNTGQSAYIQADAYNGAKWMTLGGGGRGGGGNGADAGAAGTATVNDSSALSARFAYYTYSNGIGGNGNGTSRSFTFLHNHPDGTETWTRKDGINQGSGGGGGRGGASSIFSDGGNGQSALTKTDNAGPGAGSGGTNYHLTKTPADTGYGGACQFLIYT